MGLSPIHATFLFARCRREGLETPPLVIVVNPVYFTRSHDVIDEGWLSSVMRSSAFVQMNHRDVADTLSPAVRNAYQRHFRLRNALYPVVHQEYAGNLLYLLFHQADEGVLSGRVVPLETYRYDGEIPKYDAVRNILAGNTKMDALDQSRWEVNPPETSLNMQGLSSTMAALRDARAPVLLLVFPVNLTFYVSYGVDRDTLRARYGAMSETIGKLRRQDQVFVVDLGDDQKLRFGFRDRMHADAYGHHQLAEYLVDNPEYRRFKDAVRTYYGSSRSPSASVR